MFDINHKCSTIPVLLWFQDIRYVYHRHKDGHFWSVVWEPRRSFRELIWDMGCAVSLKRGQGGNSDNQEHFVSHNSEVHILVLFLDKTLIS